MVLSMFLCVPFVKALQYRWFSYYYTGLVLQHIFQTCYLGVAIWWGWWRDWYWVQSGFLVLREWPVGVVIDFECRLIRRCPVKHDEGGLERHSS